MIFCAKKDGTNEIKAMERYKKAHSGITPEQAAMSAEIVEAVRERGMEAVVEYSIKTDGVEPRELDVQELEDAVDRLDNGTLRALEHGVKSVTEFQTKLLQRSGSWESSVSGGNIWENARGLYSVAIYVAKDSYSAAGTVISCAGAARAAGVEEITLIVAPQEPLDDCVLAAAWASGVDRVILAGGAQAAAALAFGVGFFPKADKLIGHMDTSVRAAMGMLYGELTIDCLDRAPDLCIIADRSARPEVVAADMLAQAEHSERSPVLLLTDSEELQGSVAELLYTQSGALRRKETMEKSLEEYCSILLCDSLTECVELADRIAPAMLFIDTSAPMALLEKVQNAGAVFLGEWSSPVLGEYAAGSAQLLPAAGQAARLSPLSAADLVKKTTIVKYSEQALDKQNHDIMNLARAEMLTGHANAIKIRLK